MCDHIKRGRLHSKTLELLKAYPLTLPAVYKDTGIPYYWLKKFKADEIADPSVNRVEKLYEYLTRSSIEV